MRELLQPYLIAQRYGVLESLMHKVRDAVPGRARGGPYWTRPFDGGRRDHLVNVEAQDPFDHFSRWTRPYLADPRVQLSQMLTDFIAGTGLYFANDIQRQFSNDAVDYYLQVKAAVLEDSSSERCAHDILLRRFTC